MSQPNQPPNGPDLPYGQQSPQGQPTPPPQPQDPYGGSAGSYAGPYGGQPAQPQPAPQPQPSYSGGYESAAPQYQAQKRSSTLGVVALVLAVLAAIGYVVFAVLAGQATLDLANMSGGAVPEDPEQLDQETTNKLLAVTGFTVAQVVPALLGLAGLICGIVSAATARGRAFGIIAIVLAVLAPLIAFVVYGTIVSPIAQ